MGAEVSGTATGAIKLPDVGGHFGIPESLEVLIEWMPDSVIQASRRSSYWKEVRGDTSVRTDREGLSAWRRSVTVSR